MIEFKTVNKFWSYVRRNEAHVMTIEELSSEERIYVYIPRFNEVGYFNYNVNDGWVCEYLEAKVFLAKEGVDLRSVLARCYGGIQFSRKNYLDQNSVFLMLEGRELKYVDALLNFLDRGYELKPGNLLADDTILLDQLSTRLNDSDVEKVMEFELPVLFLFADYAVKKYGNKISVMEKTNQFKEPYKGLHIDNGRGSDVDLSDLVFRVLYPDYDRDDFVNEEDVKVDLMTIKNFIDYLNSKKYFKIEDR